MIRSEIEELRLRNDALETELVRLRDSEDHYRHTVELSPQVAWTADEQGNITSYSHRWLELTGQAPGEPDGAGWLKVLHPGDLARTTEVFFACLASGDPVDVEYRVHVADAADYHWMRARAYPRRDAAGRIVTWYGVVEDIHDRKLAEDKLRFSEEQFRVFAQAMPNHVWAGTPDGSLYWFNEQVYAYSGARHSHLDGVGWTSLVHTDDLSDAAAAWEHALATGTVYETEFRIRRADGAYRWFLVRAEPVRAEDGSVVRWVGTNTDIHDQKLVQDKLSLFNETLAQQVAQRTAERDRMWRLSTDIMLVARYDATIEAVNPAWTTLLGWSEDDLIGRAFLEMVHPEDVASTLAEVGTLAEGLTTLRFENRYRRQDGQYRWLSWTAVPAEDFIHAVGRDITAQKEATQALAHAEDQLRQAQKMEAVGQLTGGVAHDFNNFLTVMRSSTDLLKRPDLPEERRQRYITAISETVDRAAKITAQLLAFSRRQTLQPTVFDVRSGIQALADMLRTLTGSRIDIVTDLPDAACFVDADPSQFDTAIVNMAVNARDAMQGQGRLTITVHPIKTVPAIRSHPPIGGDFVAVCIEDTGSGIAPEQMERIFEPFFTTKDVGQGTGLGLSQVFGFAKQSGGEVRVQSEVGKGSMFVLYLPRAAAEAQPSVVESEPEALIDGHGTCVLVVEDNTDVGTFATQTLAELGYVTVWAANAAEALIELERDADRFDVVFSDVVMPGMNGIDLAQEVRRLHHDLPVVLASGYSHVLAQNGTYGFELLHKPYSVEQLSRILRKAATWQRRMRILGR